MGIPKAQSRYFRPLIELSGRAPSAPSDVTSLHIDATAIIYAAVNRVCGIPHGANGEFNASAYTTALKQSTKIVEGEGMTQLELSIIKETVDMLRSFLTTYNPSALYFIAFDGVVPSPKLNQQRSRRWLSAHTRELVPVTDEGLSNTARARNLFDTTQITPGTKFMARLDAEILATFPTQKVLGNKAIIVYSSYRVPGEGEHKIMEMLRSDNIPMVGSHVVISSDSDMVVLASTLSMDGLHIYREALQGPNPWIDVSLLRYNLSNVYGENARYDMVLLLQLLGNDFVPPQPSFLPGPTGQVSPPDVDTEGRLPSLLEIYKEVGPIITRSEDGIVIDWSKFRSVLTILAETEYERLKAVSPHADNTDPRWSNYIFQGKRDKEEAYEDFRAAWYDRALGDIRDGDEVVDIEVEDIGEDKITVIGHMARYYLMTLSWVCVYYLEGRARADHVYPYRYAPLLRDILDSTWTIEGDMSSIVVSAAEYQAGLPSLNEQVLAVVPTRTIEPYGTIEAVYDELFPLPSDITVDTLGLTKNIENAEIVAIHGLPVLTISNIEVLLGPDRIYDSVENMELTNQIVELITTSWEADKDLFEPSVDLVLEAREQPRSTTTKRAGRAPKATSIIRPEVVEEPSPAPAKVTPSARKGGASVTAPPKAAPSKAPPVAAPPKAAPKKAVLPNLPRTMR
jgi:hypothetical protein